MIFTLVGSLLDARRRGGPGRAVHSRRRLDLVLLRRPASRTRFGDRHAGVDLPAVRDRLRGQGAAVPFHGWVVDTYRATPTPVLVLLSAVLSKVGVYGFLRIVLPILPDAAQHFQDLMLALAVFSILYGSVLAFSQDEPRLVVAYSSIAQLGFITLGIFCLDDKGAQGALMQMVNHALVTAAAVLHHRRAHRARRRLAHAGPHGRHGQPRARARHPVPGGRAGHPGHARDAQLRGRDPDPVRHLRGQARLRPGGHRGRGARRRLHDPRVPALACTTAAGRSERALRPGRGWTSA
ncbi:MAG: proton-conducting transporter membrane subunit [Thermoleophilaceae bacterium]